MAPELLPDVGYTLAEVDLYAAVVNEDVVHLEVGGLTGLVVVIADEGVAQGVPCLVVLDDVTRRHIAEPRAQVEADKHGVSQPSRFTTTKQRC